MWLLVIIVFNTILTNCFSWFSSSVVQEVFCCTTGKSNFSFMIVFPFVFVLPCVGLDINKERYCFACFIFNFQCARITAQPCRAIDETMFYPITACDNGAFFFWYPHNNTTHNTVNTIPFIFIALYSQYFWQHNYFNKCVLFIYKSSRPKFWVYFNPFSITSLNIFSITESVI